MKIQVESNQVSTFSCSIHILARYAAACWAEEVVKNRVMCLKRFYDFCGVEVPAGLERVQLLKQDRRLIAGYAADYHVMAVAGGRDLNDASRNATWSWAYDAVIGERDWDEIAAQVAKEFVLH